MLTSLPIEQPQPNQEFYGLDVLNLFETYTRAQFEAAGGPLIPFDPARPEQDWWDDTYAAIAPTQSVSYNAVVSGAGGTAAIGSFTQTAAQMATPNFKGLPNYPKWIPAATRCSLQSRCAEHHQPGESDGPEHSGAGAGASGGAGRQQHRGYWSKFSHAAQYRSDCIPGDLSCRTILDGCLPWFFRAASSSMWDRRSPQKYSAGMGAPGSWVADATQISGLSWQATAVPDGSASTAPALPVPCRALLANERLMTSLVGGLGFRPRKFSAQI